LPPGIVASVGATHLVLFGGAGLVVATARGLAGLAVVVGGNTESMGPAVAVGRLTRLAWWWVAEDDIC
jgi:hypothetical protein